MGDLEPPCDAYRGARAAGARPADLRAGAAPRPSASRSIGRPYRVLYSSGNASAICAAVLSGLAVSVFPESGLRPGMRVLSAADGFPELPPCRIGLVRNPHERNPMADALAEHVVSSLDNLSEAAQGGGVDHKHLRGVASSTRTRSAGASSICKPRRPPLTMMVAMRERGSARRTRARASSARTAKSRRRDSR